MDFSLLQSEAKNQPFHRLRILRKEETTMQVQVQVPKLYMSRRISPPTAVDEYGHQIITTENLKQTKFTGLSPQASYHKIPFLTSELKLS